MSVLASNTPHSPASQRLAILASVIAGACTFLNVYCTQPLLPTFQLVFHASEVQVSLTVGAVTLAMAIVAPFVGLLAETFGRKKVIVPALLEWQSPPFSPQRLKVSTPSFSGALPRACLLRGSSPS